MAGGISFHNSSITSSNLVLFSNILVPVPRLIYMDKVELIRDMVGQIMILYLVVGLILELFKKAGLLI